jgi:hypothetical protein
MKRLLALAIGGALLGGCAAAPVKPADEAAHRAATARVLAAAFDAGRTAGPADPAFTPRLEEASLAWLLYRGAAREAGARRLLDLRERSPLSPLVPVFFDAPEMAGLPALQQEEDFRNGLYFNSYDSALFRPFFRQALLGYLRSPKVSPEQLLELSAPLELAVKLTPRYAGFYPNQLMPETRAALEAFLKEHPQGTAADRVQMLLLWDQRSGAWAREREQLEKRLADLAASTTDELLKLELRDALVAPLAKPERAFWMSAILPGLGQIAHGDLQGGILLGGLTLSAWIWMGSKLAAAQGSDDDAARKVAYGDAAWAGGLALLGHGFTAMNAAEQARFINIVIEWDVLSKDRLQAETGRQEAPAPAP